MRKDFKIQSNKNTRGYYQNIYDKYMNNAKEYISAGDNVMSEYNLQYAEHYMRFMNEKFPINSVLKNEKNEEKVENNAKLSEVSDTTVPFSETYSGNTPVLKKINRKRIYKNKQAQQ